MIHVGPIAGISAHGRYIATAGYDNKVILWDSNTHKPLARGMHDHLVNNCAFSPDGKWLVSASSDYSARLWALPALRLTSVLSDHGDDVDMAVFSPDSQYIATCALDRQVRVFNLQGECLVSFKGHTGNVLALAWTSDGRHLVSTSVDGTIRQWDLTSRSEFHRTDLNVRTDSLEISAQGVIYAGDDLGRIVIIQGEQTHYVQAHRAGIKKVVWDEAQTMLVCLSYDRTMSMWSMAESGDPQEKARTELPEPIWARAAVILPNGKVATGTFGSTYAVFDIASNSWNMNDVVAGHGLNDVLKVNSELYTVGDAGTVFQNGRPIAEMGSLCNFLVATKTNVLTGGQMGTLFDARSGKILYKHHSPLNCGLVYVDEDEEFIVIGAYTGELLVFHQEAGGYALLHEIKVYENAVKGLSYANGVLFSVCASTDIAWHRVADWSLLKELDHAHDKIANDCCAIDDEHFATVSRDRTLRIWSDRKTEIYPSPHPNSVKCISISQDRSNVLTGCYGGTLAMFNVPKRRWSKVSRPTVSGISSITWDESNQCFLASSYDGHIYPMKVVA